MWRIHVTPKIVQEMSPSHSTGVHLAAKLPYGSDDESPAATTASLGDVSKEINTVATDPKLVEPTTKFVRFTRKQAQLLRATEEKDHLNGPHDNKIKITKETNNNDKVVSDTEVESEQEEAGTDNLALDSSDVAQKTAQSQPMTTNHPRLRDRTCEYCGAVKPTPAALARHLRKHTGERPFVCQGCNKAYKAKRSLQLHQLTYHPELVNKTPPHQASGVSLCTSSLLREALETRIKQDLSNYSGPHLDETTGEFVDDGSCEHSGLNCNPDQQSEETREQETPSMIGALLSKTVNMPTIQTPGYPGDLSKNEEEESAEKLNNRTCYICGKVCSKPCDLKRHILMHTGERPFRCEVCGKCFKAKASMLYHQRAAHNMAVELSQGLEERYLRLKNRSLMKSLHVQDQLKQEYEQSVMTPGSSQTQDDLEDLGEAEGDYTERNLFSSENCSVHYSEGGISRQISHTSDGSGLDDDSAFNESLENGNETVVIDDGEFTCKKLRIRNETVIVTRLDGVNSSTGTEVSMFKCYMCGRMFSSLNRVQCHLSMHFELEITTYQCKYCDAAFKQKSQMVQHVLKHKIKPDQEEGFDNISEDDVGIIKDEQLDSGNDLSGISPSFESDKTKVKSDGSDISPDANSIKQIRFNGNHECKYCRKTFSRQFLLQRHERIHTGQKAFYCKECGKGFSESVNLTQHLSLFHSDSPQVRQAARLYNKARYRSLHRVNYWDKYTKQSQNQLQKAIESLDKSSSKSIPELEKHENFEKAKELLEKDGIKGEVTVVMPSAPPSNQSETAVSAPSPDPVLPESVTSEGIGDQEDSSNSEIMTAPKRSLISFCKEGPQVKSRRKASLPTKFGNGSPESGVQEEDISFKDEVIRVKNEESDEAESSGSGNHGNSDESPAYSTAKMVASMNPLLLANNTSSTLGASLLGSGPGLLPCISTPTSSSVASLINLPISVQCSVSDASAAKCTSPTQSNSSTSQASPADPEALVGCPRVQWNTPPMEDPSPQISFGRESERKPLPDWHPLSKVALNQIVTHDGRKVTSLSRTHSRLHVVNQPVDRDQVCKPTVLADGRAVYRCFFCAKDFLSFSDINRHMDFHEDIRPYKCQFCDYYARTNSQLKVHMMRHQGIREFCCKLCNYKGVTQSDLNRHMKSQIHMLKARNECKRCGEGFVTPKNLEKHLEESCRRLVKKENLDQSDFDS